MANSKLLGSGLRKLGILVFLLITSPLLLTLGFKALKQYKETDQFWIAILLLSLAAILIIFTIFFAFKTFKTLMDAFFND